VQKLLRKWLKAGVMEAGGWRESLAGTPQGGVVKAIGKPDGRKSHARFDRGTCRPDFALGRRKDDRFYQWSRRPFADPPPAPGSCPSASPPPGRGPTLARRRGRLRRMSKQRTEDGANESTSLADRRWRQEDAEKVLAAREESGLSLSKFAGQQGVNVQRLSWWRKQLEERGCAGGRRQKRRAAGVSFIPAVMSASPSVVVLRLPRGVEIEVADAAAVPTAWLAAR